MGWKGTIRSLEAAARRAERESLRRQRELEKKHKLLEKMQEIERAAYEVQVYENYIDVLISVHRDSSEPWNWEAIQATSPPEKPTKDDLHERHAQHNLASYKLGFIDKLLKRVETIQSRLVAVVEDGVRKDEQNYQKALKEYKQEYADWENLHELAKRIISGNLDAYTDAIGHADPFSELNQFGSKIDFKVNTNSQVEVTLNVNGEDIVPSEIKTLLQSGKLSVKKMTKSRFYELYQDYVCSSALRIARELFALLPIETANVTAVGKLLNTKTGYMEEQPILSITIPRETLSRLNFDLLDPSDSMDNFLHKMKFSKTKGFQPIERILHSNLNSS